MSHRRLARQRHPLLADSLDILDDTLVYALSLLLGAQVIAKRRYGLPPQAPLVAVVDTDALAGNIICLILTRHREDDENMSSVWIYSRNDLFADSGVAAAALVARTHSNWPDLLIGAAITALFLRPSLHVISGAQAYHASIVENQTSVRGRG